MANVPTFVNASAKAAGTGAVTPNLPASLQANDIVILVATTIAGGSISITTNGSIGTWNAISGSPVDVTGGEKIYAWWGRWSSGSTGPTVTPGSDHCCAGTVGYRGCITDSTVINNQATGTETTSDTSFSFATGISTTVKDCLCVCTASNGADSNSGQVPVMTNSNLASLNSRVDFCTNSGGGGGFGLSDGSLAVAGAIGTFACTMGTSSPKAYVAFALRPVNETISKTTTGKARIQNTSSSGSVSGDRDQFFKSQNSGLSIGDAAGHKHLACWFIASSSYTALAVRAQFQRVLSPAWSLSVRIFSDSSGVPGSAIGATSASIAASTFPTSGWGDGTFTGLSASLTAGTKYWIVFTASATDAANYLGWRFEQRHADQTTTQDKTYYSSDASSWSVPSITPLTFAVMASGMAGLSRITASTTATQTGKARITATTTRTQLGKSNIRATTTKTQTGKANIASANVTTTETTTGKSRIQLTTSRTTTGKARITASTIRTIGGVARVTATTSRTQPGKARVQIMSTQTSPGKSRIQQTASGTQTGRARLEITTAQEIGGTARIESAANGDVTVLVGGLEATGAIGTVTVSIGAQTSTSIGWTEFVLGIISGKRKSARIAVRGIEAIGAVGQVTVTTSSNVRVTGVAAMARLGAGRAAISINAWIRTADGKAAIGWPDVDAIQNLQDDELCALVSLLE